MSATTTTKNCIGICEIDEYGHPDDALASVKYKTANIFLANPNIGYFRDKGNLVENVLTWTLPCNLLA